jgi:hypothetical protein
MHLNCLTSRQDTKEWSMDKGRSWQSSRLILPFSYVARKRKEHLKLVLTCIFYSLLVTNKYGSGFMSIEVI